MSDSMNYSLKKEKQPSRDQTFSKAQHNQFHFIVLFCSMHAVKEVKLFPTSFLSHMSRVKKMINPPMTSRPLVQALYWSNASSVTVAGGRPYSVLSKEHLYR